MFKSKNGGNKSYKCTVRLLEDTDILECEFQPFHRGSYVVDFICDQLKIKEKDYFGLRYVDVSQQRHWLDLGKFIIKQCKDVDPILFSFRVKFYPADPFRLTGNARIMLYQQLKRDLRHGRLYCSIGEAAALGSLIVQEELGDFNEEIHVEDYIASMNLALRQTEALEKKIMKLHRKRQPYQDPSVAIDEFMGIARGLETYGIDPHPVKDYRGSELYIGINYSGISTFISGKRNQHIRWNEVHKLNFEGKMFIAHLSYSDTSREPKKHTIGFKCSSNVTCKYLWRCATEQMLFFTLPNSQHAAAVVFGGGFFSWGTKFKYTGRTEREILTESINALREQKVTNSSTCKRKASSVPATPSSPQGDVAQIRYSSLPRSTMSEPLNNFIEVTDSLGNIVIRQNNGYDIGNSSGVQMSNLEPVSEEARLRVPFYYENLNILDHCGDSETANLYLKPENSMLYSSGMSGTFYEHDSEVCVPPKNSAYFQYQSHITPVNSSLTLLNTSKNNENQPMKKYLTYQNCTNSAKSVRKFHFINTFIPSFMFVVIAMTISAIFVLESEFELFEQIRNLPEMLSLRYQYYQPLKEYILQKIGSKL